VKNILIGFIVGIILVGGVGWTQMPGMMIIEYQSPHGLNETVEKIKASAIENGWIVTGLKPLHKAVKKHINKDIAPVILINMCQADHAYNILKEDKNRVLSVMMPCTISVYEKTDGKTYIGAMNAGLLGTMFGGSIAEIMGKVVAEQQQTFINAALEK
jgi:uncharacterized protein (DUF302 family)